MKSLQHKSQVHVSLLVMMLDILVWIQTPTAQLSLSTPTDVQCYGDQVSLVCTHPVLPQVPEFPQADVTWRRDGGAISTIGLGRSKLNFTNSRLQFTITEDTTGNYTCFLFTNSGATVESNSAPVRPLEPQPPSTIVKTTCHNTSIAFTWTHTPMECYKNRTSYYVSWVNINNNTESGSDTTGATEYNITGLVANGNYTISVQAVVDRNVQSTAVSRNVMTRSPKPPRSITLAFDVTSVSISLEHDNDCSCFQNQMYFVTWQLVNASDNSKIENYTMNGTVSNIENLKSNTSYLICVSAVCPLDGRVHGGQVCLSNTTSVEPFTTVGLTSELHYILPPPIVFGVLLAVLLLVILGICCWKTRKSRKIDCVRYESLGLLQVTDTLNQNGVKIISVRGHCVSSKCDPCHCRREATTVDVYGNFNEKSFVMTFLKSGEDNMEGFIVELLQQKSILSADYCFALWAGGSVPRKVQLQFKKEPEWRKGNFAVLPVQGLPWKVGSKEEKRFVRLFKASHPSLPIETLSFSSQDREVTSAVEESDQVTVTIPPSVPPQVDVVKLVNLLLISKPPTTEETDGDVKIPIESAYASVNAPPLGNYEPVGHHSADALLSKQDTSVVSGGRRRSYTRASFIEGVVSVLEILRVTILSVGNRCRRFECQNANTCKHLDTFQPDVVGVFGDASFVIKCVLHRHDGDVTGDHVATLDNVQTGLGLPLGLLVYDHMEGGPQLLSQQMPNGCSLVRVGAFTWDSDWVESTLIALCKAFKPPLAVDTHRPVHQVQYTHISVDKNRPVPNPSMEKTNYLEISAIGEKAAQLVEDKPPPVPPKKETNPNEEQFQTDVIEALAEIGMTLHLRELDFFTATYQSMGFLGVSRVESEEDVTPADVEKVVRAKTKMAASRAVLICNQDTMGSDRLVDLQEDSCYFIKAGGYGTEKWKNHLISNFKEMVGDWIKEQNPGPHHSVEGGVLEEDKGVLHPKKGEGVGPPEEESGSSQPVEETGVVGWYDVVQVQESSGRMPPITLVTSCRLESDVLSEEESPLSNSEFADDFGEEKYKNTAPMMGIARGDLDENYNTSHCSYVNPGLESNQPPADPFRSQPHGDIDHTQAGPVVGCFTSSFDYTLEDDDTVPLIEWENEDLQISVQETSSPLTDDQHVKHVFPKVANDNSESEDLQISVQETTPPDTGCDEICISGVANNYKKNTAPMMGIARGDLDENYNKSHCSYVNPGLESNQSEDYLTSVEEIIPPPENNYSESEDLQISVQETSPPYDGCDEIYISRVANGYKKPPADPFRSQRSPWSISHLHVCNLSDNIVMAIKHI